MIRKAIVIFLSITILLALPGCTSGISQEEYDAIMAGLNAVQDEISILEDDYDALVAELDDLQDEITSLEAEVEDLKGQQVEDAWAMASLRYTTLRDSIAFDLEDLAPWVGLPETPSWLDSAHLCSTILVNEPEAYEAVCLVTLPDQQLFMTLSEYGGITTAMCQGGSQEYLMTINRDLAGNIVEVMMEAGETSTILSWSEVEGEKFFTCNIDEEMYEVPWSDEPGELEDICTGFVNWLSTISMTGGLIAQSDQPLMFLGMGGLYKSLSTSFLANWRVIASRIAVDILHGVPASGWW
ncbi:coiled-coil domain-containing protein [Chloroflexota bacterium]